MEDCSERFRIGHDPATVVASAHSAATAGSCGIHELLRERRLLSKQRNDFDYVIYTSGLWVLDASIVGAFSGGFESWR
jgi:hypothetical protein